MPRRLALVALWAVFAVASVSVGFGAASLVSDPFTDVNSSAVAADPDPQGASLTEPAAGSTARATQSSTPATKKPASVTPTGSPTPSGGTRTVGPTKSPRTASPVTVKGGIPTRGGYVSATCRGHLVTIDGAAPALSWRVASWTRGQSLSARVRLEPAQDAQGEEIEVTATCLNGTPVLTSDDHQAGGGDGGGGSGGGGDDSGGSGDSSGPGDG